MLFNTNDTIHKRKNMTLKIACDYHKRIRCTEHKHSSLRHTLTQ